METSKVWMTHFPNSLNVDNFFDVDRIKGHTHLSYFKNGSIAFSPHLKFKTFIF